MKRLATLLLSCAALALPAAAQEIATTPSQPLQLPADTFFGAAAGVATNSRGDVFVYTRNGDPTITLGGSRAFAHGGSSLYEFAPDGKFLRQIGKENYGFLAAQAVRVDAHDNIWVVDAYSNMVIKMDPEGRIAMLLGRKPEAVNVPAAQDNGRAPPGAPAASGMPSDLFEGPADVAFDGAGNIFVADGLHNARVAKFNAQGVFQKSWGGRGAGEGQFASPRSIAVDAAGNVYVADRGNNRIQVFDNNGVFKKAITGAGDPMALCISPGAHQYIYASNSNPVDDLDHGGEIFKLELDGTVVGRFGRAGKLPGEFGTVNAIDCRNPAALYVAEMGNWRVQKIALH
jgi:DNA-binding beta-propeller fold protein YncE